MIIWGERGGGQRGGGGSGGAGERGSGGAGGERGRLGGSRGEQPGQLCGQRTLVSGCIITWYPTLVPILEKKGLVVSIGLKFRPTWKWRSTISSLCIGLANDFCTSCLSYTFGQKRRVVTKLPGQITWLGRAFPVFQVLEGFSDPSMGACVVFVIVSLASRQT